MGFNSAFKGLKEILILLLKNLCISWCKTSDNIKMNGTALKNICSCCFPLIALQDPIVVSLLLKSVYMYIRHYLLMIFMSGREMVKEHKARTRYHQSVFPYTVNTSYKTVNLCTLCDFRLPPRRDSCAFMAFYATQISSLLPTFRDNLSVLSSRVTL